MRVGVFDLDTALLLLAGANGGSGLNYAFMARRGEATGRHILFFQAAQKLSGTLVLLLPLLLARGSLNGVVGAIPADEAGKLAWVFLAVQVCGSTACTALHEPLSRLLDRIAPPRREDELAKPAFLVDEALQDPSLALDLAEREQLRLMQRLPLMLERLREDGDRTAPPPRPCSPRGSRWERPCAGTSPPSWTASRATPTSCGRCACSRASPTPWRCMARGRVRGGRPDRLHRLGRGHGQPDDRGAAPSAGRAGRGRPDRRHRERRMSLALFGQRQDLMEQIRTRLMADDKTTPARVQEALFQTTILFERIVWLARDTLQALTHVGPARLVPGRLGVGRCQARPVGEQS